MKIDGTVIPQVVIDSLWNGVAGRKTFTTDELYWPANALLANKGISFTLARRLVVKWKNEGRIRKPQNSKRNAPWEVV